VDDAAFSVRAVTLDHGIPVLALAFEQKPEQHVNRKGLWKTGCQPGPWVGELKHRIAMGETDGEITLTDGRKASVADLADGLIRVTPGDKLVYASDLADTPANRSKLIRLARGAHTFFCEAAFLTAHRRLAAATGHLTARACGEIAAEAGVKRLVPFHLSKRYDHQPGEVFEEVRNACPRVDVSL
jgi:ribonuclease BN (tRNA processing enzyme)